jgi:hypothetical protein
MCLPVTSTEEPRFLVHVAHRAQISTKDFEISVLSDIVFGHLEHAQMKVSHWTERTACDENYRDLVWVANDSGKTMVWEGVVWRICEFLGEMDGRRRHWEGKVKRIRSKYIVITTTLDSTYLCF